MLLFSMGKTRLTIAWSFQVLDLFSIECLVNLFTTSFAENNDRNVNSKKRRFDVHVDATPNRPMSQNLPYTLSF